MLTTDITFQDWFAESPEITYSYFWTVVRI